MVSRSRVLVPIDPGAPERPSRAGWQAASTLPTLPPGPVRPSSRGTHWHWHWQHAPRVASWFTHYGVQNQEAREP